MQRHFNQHREDAIKNRIHYWIRIKHMMEMYELKQKKYSFPKEAIGRSSKNQLPKRV